MVKAGCVQSDINAQYSIRTENSPSSRQTNSVNTNFGENCLGNSSHGNNLQIYSGNGTVNQNRQRSVELDSTLLEANPFQNTPRVNVEINQQLDLPILPSEANFQ